MKKAILFDLDGTLWDSTMEIEIVWRKIALQYKININEKKIKDIMGLTKDEIIQKLFKNDYKKRE